jgi:hypothetical protein
LKEQIVEIVKTIEKELLSIPAKDISSTENKLAMRSKKEDQLIEEPNIIANKLLLKKYPQLGIADKAIMKSLLCGMGVLGIAKETRVTDTHNIEPQNRLINHNSLASQSNTNPWIRKGSTSARYLRSHRSKVNNWIPSNFPYWK